MSDHILFIYQGKGWWSGVKEDIRKTGSIELLDFIKASEF
jgi:phospholipid/cholesterol/gamma-HCH transport system ATP-binding protein